MQYFLYFPVLSNSLLKHALLNWEVILWKANCVAYQSGIVLVIPGETFYRRILRLFDGLIEQIDKVTL